MRDKIGQILEGLIDNRIDEGVDDIARNKNLIHKIQRNLQRSIKDGRVIRNPKSTNFEVLWMFTMSLSKPTIEVYQEGDLVVFGLPLSCFTYTAVIDKNATAKRNEEVNNFIYRMGLEQNYSRGRIEEINNSIEMFHEEFDGFLDELEKELNQEKLQVELNPKAYPKYQRRDYLPLLSLDFKKGTALAILDSSAVDTASRSSRVEFDRVNWEEDFVVERVCREDYFPRGLLRFSLLFKTPHNMVRDVTY